MVRYGLQCKETPSIWANAINPASHGCVDELPPSKVSDSWVCLWDDPGKAEGQRHKWECGSYNSFRVTVWPEEEDNPIQYAIVRYPVTEATDGHLSEFRDCHVSLVPPGHGWTDIGDAIKALWIIQEVHKNFEYEIRIVS